MLHKQTKQLALRILDEQKSNPLPLVQHKTPTLVVNEQKAEVLMDKVFTEVYTEKRIDRIDYEEHASELFKLLNTPSCKLF